MYSFEGVTLDRKNGEYIVAVDGVEISADLETHQLRNPILAANRFTTAVSEKLSLKRKSSQATPKKLSSP